jgi:hypothetical protein
MKSLFAGMLVLSAAIVFCIARPAAAAVVRTDAQGVSKLDSKDDNKTVDKEVKDGKDKDKRSKKDKDEDDQGENENKNEQKKSN